MTHHDIILHLILSHITKMRHLTADAKHAILLEYRAHSPTHNLEALARRHGIRGGRHTIGDWLHRWDGTASSLEERPRPGRPPLVNQMELTRIMEQEIGEANADHRAINYRKVKEAVEEEAGVHMSVRSIRRHGRSIGVQHRGTKKRTVNECQCMAYQLERSADSRSSKSSLRLHSLCICV
jgi:transposase